MSITEELAKLQQLHESGALSDEEFARAKEAVLNETPPARAGRSEGEGLVEDLLGEREGKETLGTAANRYVSFQIVMSIIGLILFAIFFLAFFLPAVNRMGGPSMPFQNTPAFRIINESPRK
jgi:hypothetical protein